MELKLTKRLAAAAMCVRDGAYLADVGCDHGLLCAALLLSGKAERAWATDINEAPLSGAKALFERCGLAEKVTLLRTNGLTGVDPDVTDIAIAGMGAETIEGILERAAWVKAPSKRLALLPASRPERLRAWLAENGFALLYELPVCERGQCYSAMAAQYGETPRTPDCCEAFIGLIRPDTPDGRKYLETLLLRAKKQLAGLEMAVKPKTEAINDTKKLMEALEARLR